MRREVRQWVERVVQEKAPQAPVLEVGALNINGTCRDLFPQESYIGLDTQEGKGVDMVGDIMEPLRILYYGFNTVLCLETLEHIAQPFKALMRMHDCLIPGGLFIGSWVFKFAIHHAPDYWRVTPAGFRYALEQAGFEEINIETEGEGPVGVFATARRPNEVAT